MDSLREWLKSPWKAGQDMFAGWHVYSAKGERLTNDRMNGTEGWPETAHLIAAAPLMYEVLEAICTELADGDDTSAFQIARFAGAVALANARGETHE